MMVEVRPFATLRRYVPECRQTGAVHVDIPEGAVIADLMELLAIPIEETKVIMRNFRQAELHDELSHGDRVAFIPAVGGG